MTIQAVLPSPWLRRCASATRRLQRPQDLDQLAVNELVATHDIARCERVVIALDAGDGATGFAHYDLAGRNVPRLQIALPVAVEASGGDKGEIERGGAETAE